MNRRNFLTGIIAACIAPTILPSAKLDPRRWKVSDGCQIYRRSFVPENLLTRASIQHLDADQLNELWSKEIDLEAQKRFVNEFFYGVPMHDEVAMRNLEPIHSIEFRTSVFG